MYNSTLGSYQWDATTNFTLEEYVFGPYTETHMEHIPWEERSVEVEIIREEWDVNGSYLVKVNETRDIRLFLVFDNATQSFTTMWGVSY